MKLVILDRDGVINFDSPDYIQSPEEWRPLEGSLEAVALLTQKGLRVVVATNQSGVARGLFDMATLNAIHAKMHKAVNHAGGRIDAVFYCPDAPGMDCTCRKPRPGMLISIGERFNVPLDRVPSVGDKLSDLQAAHAVGARPILVLTGNGRATRAHGGLPEHTQIFPDLLAVAQALVQ
jgi:D-glycero-D-manno-heptose 1,7-bisphosphate phosphatase